MTNEEMQKTMEFIVEQQAQSSSKIEAVVLAQDRNEKKWEKTEEGIRALLSVAEIHERQIAIHERHITAVGQGIQKLTQEILNLGETTRNTDEHLNALINIVERQISEGRNGKL